MNETDTIRIDTREESEPGGPEHAPTAVHGRSLGANFKDRLGELEMENARLHRLIAELLIKNQQLRRAN